MPERNNARSLSGFRAGFQGLPRSLLIETTAIEAEVMLTALDAWVTMTQTTWKFGEFGDQPLPSGLPNPLQMCPSPWLLIRPILSYDSVAGAGSVQGGTYGGHSVYWDAKAVKLSRHLRPHRWFSD